MIKRLFIFSDMQFDDSFHGAPKDWTTDHMAITQAYEKAGYTVPEIVSYLLLLRWTFESHSTLTQPVLLSSNFQVYWNLQGVHDRSKPVTADQPGVALLSGFSPNLLKIFMESDEEELRKQLEEFAIVGKDGEEVKKSEKSAMNPVDVMMKAIGKKSFEGLKVLD